jgi:hypothetical protein
VSKYFPWEFGKGCKAGYNQPRTEHLLWLREVGKAISYDSLSVMNQLKS